MHAFTERKLPVGWQAIENAREEVNRSPGLSPQAVILSNQVLVESMGAAYSENAFTHLFNVESPTPRSAETFRHPLSSMLRVDCRTMVQSARCAPHPF
jgi:hypothetical protein